MGFLRKLLGIGATVGATIAAVKVADQYKENNPDGVKDVNGDGRVDAKDVFSEVTRAAAEVYTEAAANVKERAPEIVRQAKETFGGSSTGD